MRDVFATRCEGCGAAVSDAEQEGVRVAYDHIDLPPLKPIVTRVVLHACTCRGCGKRVAGRRAMSPFTVTIRDIKPLAYLHLLALGISHWRLEMTDPDGVVPPEVTIHINESTSHCRALSGLTALALGSTVGENRKSASMRQLSTSALSYRVYSWSDSLARNRGSYIVARMSPTADEFRATY